MLHGVVRNVDVKSAKMGGYWAGEREGQLEGTDGGLQVVWW